MYKFLLCWRYLRTRYIALVPIISVMLGVATMIVTNAVMQGFTHEMEERIHGAFSDIAFTSNLADGIPNADAYMAKIRRVAGDYIAGMTPTVGVPAMLSYSVGDRYMSRQVMVVGIDEATYANVSDFGQFLQHPANRERLEFTLRDGGYDGVDHLASDPAKAVSRPALPRAGLSYRRAKARRQRPVVVAEGHDARDPFGMGQSMEAQLPDPAEQNAGAVIGIRLCARRTGGIDEFAAIPGDDIEISYPTIGMPPQVRSAKFTIVDVYESRMMDADASMVFVPIRKLQELRGMIDPKTQIANFTAIQIRVKDGVDLEMVRDLLRDNFPQDIFDVETWRDRQHALLIAVWVERIVLNILLFLIIAVAGFGILAIFFMIVVEKTRDIGILKSLGATNSGVMSIFLSYGFSLGIVGAGAGLVMGLLIVNYINEIAEFISDVFGLNVFDPSIYLFQSIPTTVEKFTVAWVLLGAVAIAVLASILPARRAAKFHPVEALRYE